jgi:hypothetical protein
MPKVVALDATRPFKAVNALQSLQPLPELSTVP